MHAAIPEKTVRRRGTGAETLEEEHAVSLDSVLVVDGAIAMSCVLTCLPESSGPSLPTD